MPSRSDQLFQKRKAKKKRNLARKKSTIPERRRVLIICEGGKTEPLYLRSLVYSLGLTTAEVEVSGESGSAPKSIVEFGEKKFDADRDFDLVFFIFDRDSHDSYDEALQKVNGFRNSRIFSGKKVAAITSVPCFEIWFLLHFAPHTRPYVAGGGKSPCENLINVLKQQDGFGDYGKGQGNHFELLHGRLNQTRKNAAQTLTQSFDTGAAEHHGNPTTLMHILIDELESVVSDYERK